MAAPMPAMLAMVVCKVLFVGEPTDNDKMTGHRETEWATVNGKMLCRDVEVQLYNPDEAATMTPFACQRAGAMLGAQYDAAHTDSPWRFRKFTCPVPHLDVQTGEITKWELRHDCGGDLDTVVCESESVI